MRFSLDANAVIALLNGHAGLRERLRAHAPADFGVSAVVHHELVFGAEASARRAANLAAVARLRFEVMDLTRADAARAGAVRARLRALGTPIGPFDTPIAGQALERGLVVITHNVREFGRVQGLAVEDWV